LVRLCESSEVGERVGTELVEDSGNELGEFFCLTGTVDGEGVGAGGLLDLDWGSANATRASNTSEASVARWPERSEYCGMARVKRVLRDGYTEACDRVIIGGKGQWKGRGR
jgi:hypothetical protein